jgi:hypothetical protein
MKQQIPSRRIASNELITPKGKSLNQHVVVLEEGFVVRTHPLEKEEANTEWLQGQIVLKQDSDGIRAYHNGKQLK